MKANNKIVKTIELEGGCNVMKKISAAKQDLIDWFADDMGLEDQKDIFVDGDGRWTDFDNAQKDGKLDTENAIVFYLFDVGLTKRAQEVLLAEGFID